MIQKAFATHVRYVLGMDSFITNSSCVSPDHDSVSFSNNNPANKSQADIPRRTSPEGSQPCDRGDIRHNCQHSACRSLPDL